MPENTVFIHFVLMYSLKQQLLSFGKVVFGSSMFKILFFDQVSAWLARISVYKNLQVAQDTRHVKIASWVLKNFLHFSLFLMHDGTFFCWHFFFPWRLEVESSFLLLNQVLLSIEPKLLP